MKWEQYRSVMERYAIKTDDMATEDAYFMSTHMPFSSLELFRGGYYEEGKMPAPTKLMSEDEVFEQLIYNPDNEHRMIIVRGNHGTGKSHLIRYLKGKFERSPPLQYIILLRNSWFFCGVLTTLSVELSRSCWNKMQSKIPM